MKSDLDRLMQERGIDAFIILGSENDDEDRNYITNGIHASATVVKKVGNQPVLIVNGMEEEEAKKSGLEVLTHRDFDFMKIVKEHAGDTETIQRKYFERILDRFDLQGRLAFYGTNSVMGSFKFFNRFQKYFSDRIQLVEDEDTNIFTVARRTKDADEIAKLRESGRRSSAAMLEVREWISSHRAQGNVVVNEHGEPLTIGDVKRYLWMKLMEYGMEDKGGSVIFSQGRDAAFGHSRGESDQVLELGQSIVFDLFPRPIGGGYFHDMTRTWSIGYASDEVSSAYDLVMHAFTQSLEALTLGQKVRDLQELVCDIFEQHGHNTPRNNPGSQNGYNHSLGHGIGLDVHESPNIGNFTKEEVVFQAGDVVTIEPGLYYPERGWGVRIEDTVYLDEKGELHNLTDCPYDLIVPLKG